MAAVHQIRMHSCTIHCRPPSARPPSLLLLASPTTSPAAAAAGRRPARATPSVVAAAAKKQKPRQRKSKAERSRPSPADIAAFVDGELDAYDDDDEDMSDDDDDDGTEKGPPNNKNGAVAWRRSSSGRPVPVPLSAPAPSDFDKAALAAVDSGDPEALLEAERRATYRVFEDEEQDRAWQDQQRRIAQRERRQRLAAAAAAAAAATAALDDGGDGSGDGGAAAKAAAAAAARAAGLPPAPDPDSPIGRLLRVGDVNARPARLWNPRTGFARTREEVEAEERAAAAALAAVEGQGPTTLERVAGERRRIWEREVRRRGGGEEWAAQEQQAAAAAAAAAAANGRKQGAAGAGAASPSSSSSSSSSALPSVPRQQVLVSALGAGAAMTGAALLLRLFAASGVAAPLTGGDQAAVDALIAGWAPLPLLAGGAGGAGGGALLPRDLGLAAGCAAGVTAARLALCTLLPASFGAQTARSNAQVLSPLSWPADDALVALASGVPEELLFRGALVPATGHADAAGVAAAAALFGALHVGGGRGPAFALWAAGVGGAYGALMLGTGSVWPAALAHVLANFASATAWRMGLVRAAAADLDEGGGAKQAE